MDTPGQGDATEGKRGAALRSVTASLTATVCRAPFHHHGEAAGEGAR